MSDIVQRLETDVLWHQRRGNETIAADCQEAADELKRLCAVNEGQTRLNITLVMENAQLLRKLQEVRAITGTAGAQPQTVDAQRVGLTDAAEIECDALAAWHIYWRSLYMTDGYDELPAQFLAAFRAGYAAAERAHGITEGNAKSPTNNS